jgi:hypothetical protein
MDFTIRCQPCTEMTDVAGLSLDNLFGLAPEMHRLVARQRLSAAACCRIEQIHKPCSNSDPCNESQPPVHCILSPV